MMLHLDYLKQINAKTIIFHLILSSARLLFGIDLKNLIQLI